MSLTIKIPKNLVWFTTLLLLINATSAIITEIYHEDFDSVTNTNFTNGTVSVTYKYNTTNGYGIRPNGYNIPADRSLYDLTQITNFDTYAYSTAIRLHSVSNDGQIYFETGARFYNKTSNQNMSFAVVPYMGLNTTKTQWALVNFTDKNPTYYSSITSSVLANISSCTPTLVTNTVTPWVRTEFSIKKQTGSNYKFEFNAYNITSNTPLCDNTTVTVNLPLLDNVDAINIAFKDLHSSGSPTYRVDEIILSGETTTQNGTNILYLSTNPTNLTTTTLFSEIIDVTYQYNTTGLTQPKLNLTITSPISCVQTINGTCLLLSDASQTIQPYSNTTSADLMNVTYRLEENQIYAYVANLNNNYFNNTHLAYTTSNTHSPISTQFTNISVENSYNIYEFMANTTGTARVYVCNQSFDYASNILINPNCQEIGIFNNTPYNHTHNSFSSHKIIPFIIINGKIGGNGITVTPNMSFIISTVSGTTNVYYVPNMSRTDAVKTCQADCTASFSQTYTTDQHLHQWSASPSFISHMATGNYSGTTESTSIQQIQVQITLFEPSPPILINPSSYGSVQTTEYMMITWLNATPYFSEANISNYEINLLNQNSSLIKEIASNITQNSYLWNVYNENLSIGDYYIQVCAYDTYGLSSCDQEPFLLEVNSAVNINVIYQQLADIWDYLTGWVTVNVLHINSTVNNISSQVNNLSFEINTLYLNTEVTNCITGSLWEISTQVSNQNNVIQTNNTVLCSINTSLWGLENMTYNSNTGLFTYSNTCPAQTVWNWTIQCD